MLSTRKLTYHYGEKCIIKNLSMDLNLGTTLILVGPNGAGKSTTLRLLAKLLKPSSGIVNLPSDLRVGLLLESVPIYEELTIFENLKFFSKLTKIPSSHQKNAINKMLAIFSLESSCYKMIASLSKGLRQRVALAQALINEPNLILLDEPSIHLDMSEHENLLCYLSSIKQNAIMVISSHNPLEITTLGDEALLFNSNSAKVIGPIPIQELPQSNLCSYPIVNQKNPEPLLVSDVL